MRSPSRTAACPARPGPAVPDPGSGRPWPAGGKAARARARVRARLRDPRVVAAVAACAVSVAVYLYVRHLIRPSMIDLVVYRVEGFAVREGTDLYGPLDTPFGLRATYPPFAAVLFVPFTWVPMELLRALVVAANLGLVAVVVALSLRLADRGRVWPRAVAVPAVTAVVLWFEPVFSSMRLGQVNLAVIALVLWDFTRPAASRWRGAALGIAAGIKVTPAIFVVYLLLTGRRRATVTAVGTWAATLAVSAAVMPGATRRFWTDLMFAAERVGRLENALNQSLRGVVTRVTRTPDPGTWATAGIAAVAVFALGCAVVAYRRRGDAWGLPACAVAGLLASPISWSHHWVWCVPIAVLLLTRLRTGPSRADRWLFAGLVVFASFVVLAVPHRPGQEWHLSVPQLVGSASYVAFGLAFAVVAARRREAVRAAPGGPLVAGRLRRT